MKVYPAVPGLVVSFDLQEDLNLDATCCQRGACSWLTANPVTALRWISRRRDALTKPTLAFQRRSSQAAVPTPATCSTASSVEGKDGLRPLADLRMAKETEPI